MQKAPSPWQRFGKIHNDAGDVGGDHQVTDAVSVRYYHRSIETAVVDIYLYGTNYHGRITIEQQVWTTTCTDRRDPGGTEIWSDAVYATPDGNRTYATPEEAFAQARKLAEAHDPASIDWDGV
jgi:hypothetical protein